MRLFQNARYYPSLRPRIRALTRDRETFAGKIDAFLNFREGGAHILLPVDQRVEWAFFTNGDDVEVQRVWAREHGLKPRASASEILRAQIEEHRADVFYNLDATGWDDDFTKGLPGCVKKTIAWHAAPLQNASFSGYDLVVCNFPSIRAALAARGCRTDHFFPAYDPDFAPFASRQNRPVDVLFVGGYSRHHRRGPRYWRRSQSWLANMISCIGWIDRACAGWPNRRSGNFSPWRHTAGRPPSEPLPRNRYSDWTTMRRFRPLKSC